MTTLTAEQQGVFDPVVAAAHEGLTPYLTIHGYAGTGKTTLAAALARHFGGDAIIAAPTAKAALNLRQRTALETGTIHHLLYHHVEDTDEEGRRVLRFENKLQPGALKGKVALLDECSMIDATLAADLLRTGAHLIALGDPGQLPPVKGDQFFCVPDFELREIHRQALESPIIRQAHRVRRGLSYEPDGDGFRVARGGVGDDELLGAEAVLCWRNSTKHVLNAHIRRLRGFDAPHPQAGETVMCLRNCARFGVFNGGTYRLTRPFLDGDKAIFLEIGGREQSVPNVIFESGPVPDPNPRKHLSRFEFGYGMTVHKAQGSEFSSVVLVDEYNAREDRARWLYTGITRAAERVTVLRGAR